ncbi:MAG: SDR family oxidoreductase [Gammaproteobacteria bacterium]|nr:SDR family oxidoreductase [Gammaproteobacteria bacterium]
MVAEIEAAGGTAAAVAADGGLEEGAEAVIAGAESRFGPVDVLVNNAGVGWSFEGTMSGSMAALADADHAGWREVMRINLDFAYSMRRHRVLPSMIERAAASSSMSPVPADPGMNDAHAYAASKAAMINLTQSMARTYGPAGIRANCLAPGFVATDMVAGVLESQANPFADDATRFMAAPLGRSRRAGGDGRGRAVPRRQHLCQRIPAGAPPRRHC